MPRGRAKPFGPAAYRDPAGGEMGTGLRLTRVRGGDEQGGPSGESRFTASPAAG